MRGASTPHWRKTEAGQQHQGGSYTQVRSKLKAWPEELHVKLWSPTWRNTDRCSDDGVKSKCCTLTNSRSAFSIVSAFRWTLYALKARSGPWSAWKETSSSQESLVYCPATHLFLGGIIRSFKDSSVFSVLKKLPQVLWYTLLVRSLEFMSAWHQRRAFILLLVMELSWEKSCFLSSLFHLRHIESRIKIAFCLCAGIIRF